MLRSREMADVQITITIPEAKVAIASEGFLYLYSIPTDEETGVPLFTPRQWFKEVIRRWLRDQVARGLQKKTHDENPFDPDNDIAT